MSREKSNDSFVVKSLPTYVNDRLRLGLRTRDDAVYKLSTVEGLRRVLREHANIEHARAVTGGPGVLQDGGFGHLFVEVSTDSPVHRAILQQFRALQAVGVAGLALAGNTSHQANERPKLFILLFFLTTEKRVPYRDEAEIAKWAGCFDSNHPPTPECHMKLLQSTCALNPREDRDIVVLRASRAQSGASHWLRLLACQDSAAAALPACAPRTPIDGAAHPCGGAPQTAPSQRSTSAASPAASTAATAGALDRRRALVLPCRDEAGAARSPGRGAAGGVLSGRVKKLRGQARCKQPPPALAHRKRPPAKSPGGATAPRAPGRNAVQRTAAKGNAPRRGDKPQRRSQGKKAAVAPALELPFEDVLLIVSLADVPAMPLKRSHVGALSSVLKAGGCATQTGAAKRGEAAMDCVGIGRPLCNLMQPTLYKIKSTKEYGVKAIARGKEELSDGNWRVCLGVAGEFLGHLLFDGDYRTAASTLQAWRRRHQRAKTNDRCRPPAMAFTMISHDTKEAVRRVHPHVDAADFKQVSMILWQQFGVVMPAYFVIPSLVIRLRIRNGTCIFFRSGEFLHGTLGGAEVSKGGYILGSAFYGRNDVVTAIGRLAREHGVPPGSPLPSYLAIPRTNTGTYELYEGRKPPSYMPVAANVKVQRSESAGPSSELLSRLAAERSAASDASPGPSPGPGDGWVLVSTLATPSCFKRKRGVPQEGAKREGDACPQEAEATAANAIGRVNAHTTTVDGGRALERTLAPLERPAAGSPATSTAGGPNPACASAGQPPRSNATLLPAEVPRVSHVELRRVERAELDRWDARTFLTNVPSDPRAFGVLVGVERVKVIAAPHGPPMSAANSATLHDCRRPSTPEDRDQLERSCPPENEQGGFQPPPPLGTVNPHSVKQLNSEDVVTQQSKFWKKLASWLFPPSLQAHQASAQLNPAQDCAPARKTLPIRTARNEAVISHAAFASQLGSLSCCTRSPSAHIPGDVAIDQPVSPDSPDVVRLGLL